MLTQENQSRLRELCGRTRDESITAYEFSELERLLLSDKQALDYYRRFMSICSGLEQMATLESDSPPEIQELTATAIGDYDWTEAEVRKISEPSDRQPSDRPGFPIRRAAIAIASLAALGIFTMFVLSRRQTSEPDGFAKLIQTQQAVWSSSESPGEGDNARGNYSLRSGAALFRYDNGAEIMVQAPADFSVDQVNGASIEKGRMSVFVPPAAKGFRVTTPWGAVVDRGTRIGISTGGELSPQVHVFEGSAEATLSGSDVAQLLVQGEAVVVDSAESSFEKIAAQPLFFPRSLGATEGLPRVSGDVALLVSPPKSVRRTLFEFANDANTTVFAEKTNVRLDEDLPITLDAPGVVDRVESTGATLPAGTRVDSYLLHFSIPIEGRRGEKYFVSKGSLTFPTKVVGVLSFQPGKTNKLFAHSATDYPGDARTGLEDSEKGNRQDRLELGDDGRTLNFEFHVRGKSTEGSADVVDQVRVFVEPS